MSSNSRSLNPEDPWNRLAELTTARIALGHTGVSMPTKASLEFSLAHALARDAVNIPLDFAALNSSLHSEGYQSLKLQTAIESHRMYLQRPDLGRILNNHANEILQKAEDKLADAVVVVTDGLSSKAIELHAVPFLKLLLPSLQAKKYHVPPVFLVKYGRVAIGDAVAEAFTARLCMVLIGERPGLSSPSSMGIYFTYAAKSGSSTDANRNCISNIHDNGLSYTQALKKLLYLIDASEMRQYSGVNLKDETIENETLAARTNASFLLE